MALAVVLYATGLVVVIYAAVRRARHRRLTVWDMSGDRRRFLVALITRWLLVVWISSLLFLFEPGFALAHVALNLVWMLVWVPRPFRTSRRRIETEIAAPPDRVFEFVREVRNWKLYRDDVELVSVTPEGPLQLGSEYLVRRALPESLRRTSIRQIESRHRVSAIVPGTSYDVDLVDHAATTRTAVELTATRLIRTTETTMGLLRAWSADMLNNRRADAALRPVEQRDGQRLKEILEARPAQ